MNVGNGCSDIFSPLGDAASIQRPYFLYVGNLKPHKNFDVLLEALRKRPEHSLVAIINDKANAEAAIELSGLSAQARVVSGVSDIELAELYRGSIGLLMPSLTEGFGLPAVESLSCGRAVAYSKTCTSVAEIVGDFGVAVEYGIDAEEWANAMDTLAESELSFTHPDGEWRNQYRWSNVACNVSNHLMSVQSLNARNV
ncbi:glycosyltransferase [Arthrobacter sp. ISL-5]|uniref:glycosyltransferase n=1 Tax=Arthrobacter sp. ISL-5 TaxID=2819111 RepID=UPI001BEAAC1C|nr:glycosyltransferase [Arthrobacter sp. ISL-5]MBT2552818.1 glycosyltransferase [Arthrobacter sp. ISL-5]